MSILWNVKDLEPPFVSSYKTTSREINITPLAEIFKESCAFFEKQQFLEKETAFLSRCIYRIKLKLRSDKGSKEMQKLNRALLQYLRTDFPSHIRNFTEMLPEGDEKILHLPTKNMLDYILVRIQGVAKLMCRAAECARSAALCLETRISFGHLWKVAFTCFAVVSRLWILATDIVKFCCKFFDTAVKFSSLLKNTTAQWLSSDYVFPKSLKEWIDMDWLEDNITSNSDGKGTVVDSESPEVEMETKPKESLRGFGLFDLAEAGEAGEEVTYTEYERDLDQNENVPMGSDVVTNEKRKKKRNKKLKKHINCDEDITNHICDDSAALTFKKNCLPAAAQKTQPCKPEEQKVKPHKPRSKLDTVASLSTVKQVKTFLQSEDRARDASGSDCVLNNIDKLQWNILRKKVKLLLIRAEKSKDAAVSRRLVEKVKQVIKESMAI